MVAGDVSEMAARREGSLGAALQPLKKRRLAHEARVARTTTPKSEQGTPRAVIADRVCIMRGTIRGLVWTWRRLWRDGVLKGSSAAF